MRCFQYKVLAAVYEGFLAAGIIAPEHEYCVFLVVGYGFDDRVGESLPAYSAVGSRGSGPDCKYGVEQEDTLAGPSFKIAAGWRLRACIRENLFVNILKGRRQCHSVLDGE